MREASAHTEGQRSPSWPPGPTSSATVESTHTLSRSVTKCHFCLDFSSSYPSTSEPCVSEFKRQRTEGPATTGDNPNYSLALISPSSPLPLLDVALAGSWMPCPLISYSSERGRPFPKKSRPLLQNEEKNNNWTQGQLQ